MSVIAVCGLAAEARIAREAGLVAIAAGGDAALTIKQLQRVVADATALVSFGITGGLDPALPSGALLLPSAVVTEGGERYAVDADWHAALCTTLAAAGRTAALGDTLGAAAIAATAATKAALFRATKALAVDLESHLAARAAQAAALPFVVLRVIADPAGRDLPPAALLTLDASGRPVIPAILRSLAAAPMQLPRLLRLALDTRRALAVLRETTRLLRDQLRLA